MSASNRPLERVLASAGLPELAEVLSSGLSGSELTTLLLEVMRRRATALHPADVARRYSSDRFVAPAAIDLGRLRAAEDLLLDSIPEEFVAVVLSPVVPLGTHSAMSGVDQNNVVATIRGTDVAADATNGLALEAAHRRRVLLATDPRSAESVRLVSLQRVLRAQVFEGPHSYAHFGMLAAVTAGRDQGSQRFEKMAVADHLRQTTRALARTTTDSIRIELTDFTGEWERLAAHLVTSLGSLPMVQVVATPSDAPGGAYYAGFRFQLYARFGDEMVHLGDGGLVDWTRRLLANEKERLVISGIGVDRFALLLATEDGR